MMTGRSGGIAIEMNEQEKTETEWPGRKEESAEDRALAWKQRKVEHVVRDQWIDFRRIQYELPDGSVYEPFYSYSRRSYVVVVASDEEGRFLCVRQYRPGIRAVTTEFPAGGIERHGTAEYGEPEVTGYEDGTAAEDALSAAKRELREETGYTSEEWTPLISIPSCASISDNFAYIFRAKHCRKVSGLKHSGGTRCADPERAVSAGGPCDGMAAGEGAGSRASVPVRRSKNIFIKGCYLW